METHLRPELPEGAFDAFDFKGADPSGLDIALLLIHEP
jgi:hypothetical protein